MPTSKQSFSVTRGTRGVETRREIPGKLEIAHNGTIFLDEVGELSLRLQGLLLRFLETAEIQRVGAARPTAVNVRVIVSTSRDLWDLVTKGQFRQDLFFRLNVIHLNIPPLRERREDIPPLVDYFLERFTATNGHADGESPVRAIGPDAMEALCQYSWPGNVRQVENVVERLVVTGRRELVSIDALPPEVHTAPQDVGAQSRARLVSTIFSSGWLRVESRSGPRYIRSL